MRIKIFLVLSATLLIAAGCNSSVQTQGQSNMSQSGTMNVVTADNLDTPGLDGYTGDSSNTQESGSQPLDQQTQSASIQEQKQCAEDGQTFANQWASENIPTNTYGFSYFLATPEYHFSVKLNTCLVYVGYSSSGAVVTTSSHVNYVYNLYANEPILESDTFRTCNYPSPCTEKVNNGISGNPTLGTTDFFNQKDVLFSQ